MNLKTTYALVILTFLGGILWLLFQVQHRAAPLSDTVRELDVLGSGDVTRVQVVQGERTLDLRRDKDEWSLPGNWPTRQAEVKQLVDTVTHLHSRFAALPINDAHKLADYGLERPAVTVTITNGSGDHRLQFGEDPNDPNRFTRPTYLRLDDRNEVIRLAPGLVGLLDRPIDYYQQRRLFPGERVKKGDVLEKGERVAARTIAGDAPAGSYTVTRAGGDDWDLSRPVKDRADPDKLNTILTAIPDIWVEQFVPPRDLKDLGLDKPEQTLAVTNERGQTITLMIGKESQKRARVINVPPPPGPPGMPRQPQRQVVHDEYRYAKLKDNNQVFEIKAEKLKDLFPAVDTLRDPRLARFKSDDARKLVIHRDGHDIVLEKDKERWRLKAGPKEIDAETSKVTELLDKLSGLDAKDKDVIDGGDAKTFGLDKPSATIAVSVEETQGEGDSKTTKKKDFNFSFGKRDDEKKKLYVQVKPWERVNAVDDSLDKLVQRPALAYRGRRILDFSSSDLAKLDVKDKFTLEQDKDVWKLTAPERADVDASKAGQLVSDLVRLEAVEYVNDSPKPEELDKQYGLTKPELTVSVTYSKKKDDKPVTQKLLIGKQRGDKAEYFAQLDGEPSVFAIKKDIRDALEQSSLALLPLQLWQMKPEGIAELHIQKAGQEYRLERDGKNWRIDAGSYKAAGMPSLIDPLVNDVASLRCDKYVALTAKDLGSYGLDKPYLRVVLVNKEKEEKEKGKSEEKPKDDKDKEKGKDADKDKKKDRVILIGKPSAEGAKSRYAKLADGEAVFVIGEKFIVAVDHTPLDLIERTLLTLDPRSITTIKTKDQAGALTFERKGDDWNVVAPSAKFTADRDVIAGVLGIWSSLRAEKFAAYGDKVDLAAFGLDKPSATITVSVKKPAANEKDKTAAEEHTLLLGKTVDKGLGERFAMLDKGPGVFVLGATAVTELTHPYLDFVDRALLKFDASAVNMLQRKMEGAELEAVKKDDKWSLTKPTPMAADTPTIDDLLRQLGNLRAQRVAAYPAKDLKPFGLAQPAAVITLTLGPDDKKTQHVLKVGSVVAASEGKPASDERYVIVDKSEVVGVIPAALAKRLVEGPIHFRDRVVAVIKDEIDRATLERGQRKAGFTKVDGTWKLTSPVNADAEQSDLDDFINGRQGLARLRADDLIAEKADLEKYGLAQPEAVWRFKAGDKDALGLLIGRRDADGKRAYAKLANSDIVFLMSAKMTEQALKEYRSRTVWPSLDTAQVEQLTYQPHAGNAFTLDKTGPTWSVPGKPEVKIKSEAVSETLDALARLKAERYVVDKDADLKLYGLEPPEIAIDIQSRGTKRTLHVGRAVGESKRYYARVADDKRTEVFIMSEAEAAKIVRDLAAFTMKEEKKPKAGGS